MIYNMYDIPPFLKRNKDALLYNSEGSLVFYIPEVYFERKYAIISGEYVNLLGVLDYAIYDKNGKTSGLKQFRFPTVFLCKPSSIEKLRNTKLTVESEVQDYRLLKFMKGDEVVSSVKVPQMIDNVEEFYKLFTCGKLPTTIPYKELQNYFTESIALNGSNYGVTTQMFGFVISEMCRDPKDLSKPYRLTPMKTETGYTALSLKDIPKLISPYTAITSENWDEAVVSAIINKNKVDTPMEKLLTM